MLYFIPTPIGNLEDITLRAITLLKSADIIFCEDTRITGKLLKHFGITTTMISIVSNGETNLRRLTELLRLYKGETIAVVSDAGMPGISDPGFEILTIAQNLAIPYSVIPGASASITAAVASGLIKKDFWFIGFLPHKKGRMTAWKNIASATIPVILYESVHRIEKSIQEMQEYLQPSQRVFVGRELTKMFEEYWSGSIEDLAKKEFTLKGEFVIVIAPVDF